MSGSDRLTVSMATAKAMPTLTLSPVGFSSNVLMPMTSPRQLMSGPPEFPGFTGASVWIMSRIGRVSPPTANVRPRLLTIPWVSVPSRLNGLPMASTGSPTRSEAELPNGAAGSDPAGTSARIMARSFPGSRPAISASAVDPSAKRTSMASAPSITCSLVRIAPSASMMTPDPCPPCGSPSGATRAACVTTSTTEGRRSS